MCCNKTREELRQKRSRAPSKILVTKNIHSGSENFEGNKREILQGLVRALVKRHEWR